MRTNCFSRIRAALVTAALATAWLAPGSAFAETDFSNLGDKTFDVVLLRPLGVCNVIVGAVWFLPATLMTLPNGRDGIDDAWKQFVERPSDHAFKRDLGDF